MALTTNELRRGNLIGHVPIAKSPQAMKGFFLVNELHEKSIGTIHVNTNLFFSLLPEDCEGIPLTQELLVKCGFIKCALNYMPEAYELDLGEGLNKNDLLRIDLDGMADLIGYTPNEAVQIKYKVKYLHQLQNLYFAMTGEELPIKDL
jgi:hypothetical protein